MKRKTVALIALLSLLTAFACALASGDTWYEKENVLRLLKSEPVLLKVRDTGFEGRLALGLPDGGEKIDVPLHAVFWTLNEARFPGAASKEEADKTLRRLFFVPDSVKAAFEKQEDALCLKDPLPVMVIEPSLFQSAEKINGEEAVNLASLKTEERYAPLVPLYRGYATARNMCNVREGASPDTRLIAKVQKDAVLPILSEENGWYLVLLPDGQKGFVSPKMVTAEKNAQPEDAAALARAGDLQGAQAALRAPGMTGAASTVDDCARYLDALRFLREGDYAAARDTWSALGSFGGADRLLKKSEGLQKMPEDAVLYQEEIQNAACEMVLIAGGTGDPYFVKVYKEGEQKPSALLFVSSGKQVTLPLAPGRYEITYASGKMWYGTQKAFGEEGRYARLDDPITLQDGMRCILTFAPQMRPNGDRSPLDFSAF